jgi:hypothetical protein
VSDKLRQHAALLDRQEALRARVQEQEELLHDLEFRVQGQRARARVRAREEREARHRVLLQQVFWCQLDRYATAVLGARDAFCSLTA